VRQDTGPEGPALRVSMLECWSPGPSGPGNGEGRMTDDRPTTTGDYAREIEAYLCRKNDGHLIRIVGPSFERVCGWADRGIPLKVVFRGIDRHFERYYAKGPRRWPVRIDFCEADILDTFDEWRRAVGAWSFTGGDAPDPSGVQPAAEGTLQEGAQASNPRGRGPSLPRHLDRAALAMSSLAADGGLPDGIRAAVVAAIGRLDAVRGLASGARGAARETLLRDLVSVDQAFIEAAVAALPDAERQGLREMAAGELAPFRDRMAPEVFARAVDAATARLVRERYRLPVLALS